MQDEKSVCDMEEQIRDYKQQLDNLDEVEKKVWRQEDEEDIELMQWDRILGYMEGSCSSEDRVILQFIEEKQQVIQNIRNKKVEFAEEFEQEIKNNRRQLDWKLDDLYMQLSSMKNQQEE